MDERSIINMGWHKLIGVINKFNYEKANIPLHPLQCVISPSLFTYQFSCYGRIADAQKYEDEFKNELGNEVSVKAEDGLINIIVPRPTRETVFLKDVLNDPFFIEGNETLKIAVGKNYKDCIVVADLLDWHSALIGGQTRSGKSNFLHVIIHSLINTLTPEQIQFVLMDYKRMEFLVYEGISYLYSDVIYEPSDGVKLLKDLKNEMNKRSDLIRKANARKLKDYNAKSINPLPYLVVIIDEFQELLLSEKESSELLADIASKGVASGIHLILATQRPDAKLIEGRIKSNLVTRIAFKVPGWNDSQIILDENGAEDLMGEGDLLVKEPTISKAMRVQACFVPDEDLDELANNLRTTYEVPFEEVEDLSQFEESITYNILDEAEEPEIIEDDEVEEIVKRPLTIDEKIDKYFYQAMLYCYNEDKCNPSMVWKHLHKEKDVGYGIVEKAWNEEIIETEKLGHYYPFLITKEEFINKYKGEEQ